jgi:hypothetical protein
MSIRWKRCLFRVWVVFAVFWIALGAWLSFEHGTPEPLVATALSTLLFPAWVWLLGKVIFWTIRWMWRGFAGPGNYKTRYQHLEKIMAWLPKAQGTKGLTGGVPPSEDKEPS